MKTVTTNQKKGIGVLATIILFAGLWMLWVSSGSSLVYLKEVHPGQTGSQVCYQQGMSCLSLSSTEVLDSDGAFYGYITPSCDAQIIQGNSICEQVFDTQYGIDNVTYKKAPNAESTQNLTPGVFCLSTDVGKKGIYQYAYCVKR